MKQTTLFNYQIQKIESKSKFDNSNNNNNNNNLQEFKLQKILYKPSSVDSDEIEGFDKSKTDWIYPINYPIRDYQLQIVQECLFKNTLVCLPTGLGKTFIASVVMFNFYRWYPSGKIIFVAPTRPLVNQQMYACQNTVPIELSDIVEMTGSISQHLRRNLWNEKRVFFLTAQVLVNDLISQICPGKSIVFLVLDEAHKASKNHAYCQVIRELTGENHRNRIFRVVGLSATPGNDIITIQDVIQNLLIAHIELRTDECKDIQKYSHERLVEEIIVPLGSEVINIRDRLLAICSPIIDRLKASGAISTARSLNSLSKFGLLKMKEEYRMNIAPGYNKSYSSLLTDFSQAISLYYAVELVQQHGLKPTFLYLSNAISNSQANPQILDLMINKEFMEFYEMLQQRMSSESFISSHPKLEKLQDIVKAHFSNKTESGQKNSRVIIFSQIRDSVDEIMSLLKKLEPLIRPIAFMGQTKHVSQREQMEAMRLFTEGTANVLVSTCIGEEGLDIGEVDLIICFDSQKSPIRLVQRAGRTGRKKEGRVVMLLSEGKEVNNYRTSLSKKSRIHSAIFEGYKHLVFYPDNPRMVPLGIEPTISYQNVMISKKIKNSPVKKLRKSSKLQSLIVCKSNENQKITLNTDLNVFDSMRFLNESRDSELKTFTKTYRSNNYKKSLYQTQPTFNIGHSDLTRNLISVLKLKEMHNRGKTNILFHLSNSRILDINEPMTESEEEEEIDQHNSDSFSLSISSEIDDNFNDDFSKNFFQDCLQNIDNHVVISSFRPPLRPTLSDKSFNDLLDNLESMKPDLLLQLDRITKIIQETDLKSKSIIKPDKIENNQSNSIIDSISPVKHSNFNSRPIHSLCTSTPIVSNVRAPSIKSILSSFNIFQKFPQKSFPVHKSILNSFKIPLNNNNLSSNKSSTSLFNQCSSVFSSPSSSSHVDTQLGMETALRFFQERSVVLSCELSSDLFDYEDLLENTDNITTSVSTNDRLTPNKSSNNKPVPIDSEVVKNESLRSDDDLFSDDFDSYSPLSEMENLSPKSNQNLCIGEHETMENNDKFEVKSIDKTNSDISDSFLKDDIEKEVRSRSPSFDSNYAIDSYIIEDDLLEYQNKSNSPSFESSSIQNKHNTSLNNRKINSSSPSFDWSSSFQSDKEEEKQEEKEQSLIQPKKNPLKEFFFSQAIVSPKHRNRLNGAVKEEEEEDEDNFKNEQYESSFIDDNENSFAVNTQMHQIYLQSIKSPNLRKFPLKNANPTVVYSPTHSSDDDYVMDSFVIPDDYKTPKKKKRLLKQSNDVSVKKYKRLKTINDSIN